MRSGRANVKETIIDTVSTLKLESRPGTSVPLMQIQEVIDRVVTLLEAADRELGQTQEVAKTAITRAASILMAEIGHSAQRQPPTACATPLLRWQASRVQEYIEANIAEAIRVSDLSALVSRTEAHFSRAFKRSYGLSPHAYVLRRRIELASQLMIQSSTPSSEIALKCGFNDQPHLCKQFRKHTGATPAAWRRAQMS